MSEHELWNELGNLYFLTGAYPQAVRAYNRSIEMEEGFGRPYSNLALTYVQQGRFDEAVDLYRRSIELLAENKDKAITWNRLGNVYRYLKDYQHAVQAYRRADELDPENGEGKEEPGWLSDPTSKAPAEKHSAPVRAAETKPTLTLTETAALPTVEASSAPTSAEESVSTWTVADSAPYQADVSEALEPGSLTTWGNPNHAEDEPEWALEADPEIYAPDTEGDDLTRWLPVPEEVEDLLDMALAGAVPPPEVDEPFPFTEAEPQDEDSEMVVFPFEIELPEDADVRAESVAIAAQLGADEASREAIVALAEGAPATDDSEAPVLQTSAEEQHERASAQPAEVESAAQTVDLPTASASPSDSYEHAEQNLRQGPHLDIIVQEAPTAEYLVASAVSEPAKMESTVAVASAQSTDAVSQAKAIPVTKPEIPAPERDADEMHEIEKGLAKFKRVVQINPRNAHAWDALGNLYKAGGLYKEALLAYEQAIANDPSKALYHHHVGLVYACEGRTEEAIDAFQRVIEIDPDHGLAHATLGGYYRKMGLEELAQKHVGKAMKSVFDSENEYNRACLAAICGNTDQAFDLLRVALKNKQTYVDWILRDPDLDFIRQDPRFKQLIADYAT